MRNKYAGTCFMCSKPVASGQGFFQRDKGRWLVRCQRCVGKGNTPDQPAQKPAQVQA